MTRISTFGDDALGNLDAVGVADAIRGGAVSAAEVVQAAIARTEKAQPELNGMAYEAFEQAVERTSARSRFGRPFGGFFDGVPTFIKDNVAVGGWPTMQGTDAWSPRPMPADGEWARLYLSTGLVALGKTQMSEFGFSASAEHPRLGPVRNPWDTTVTAGASSSGSGAFVAAGVVPIAHANDGGGSIRIPAACAGLVGLKPSRGRHRDGEQVSHLPINMISEGVLTRSVRDTAAYVAACENHWRNPKLAPIGRVHGPAQRTLRIGVLFDSVTGESVDAATRAAVEDTAALLEAAGHVVEPITLPVTAQFADDFVQYWALLADLAVGTGRLILDRSFDAGRADGLSLGLRAHHRRNLHRTPGALLRLRGVAAQYARMFARHEAVLSPVLSHTTPRIGYLAPTVDFPDLIDRLRRYVAYTPLNNIAGTPAISLPAGLSPEGLPVGVQLSGAYGDERTLIELAYLLEAERPFARIQEVASACRA